MRISHGQFFKYFYVCLITIWIILSIHILYLYVDYISPKKPVKGGTFIEAVFDNISYLPYIGNNDADDLYKSFLFQSCLEPSVGQDQIVFKEEACEVKTDNYKTFYITAKKNNYWSDNNPVTIEDIYFTYNEVLKNNVWNRRILENYKNINVTMLEGDKIQIDFPKASIDNQLVLTNYILPKHILEGKTVDEYIQIFGKNPVFNGCGNIKTDSNDQQSIVFDLSKCENYYIKYYQLKKFGNFDELTEYIKNGKKNIIDSYIGAKKLDNFDKNEIILNKLVTIFYNLNSTKVNYDIRKALTQEIINTFYTGEYSDYIIKDNFLFDSFPQGGDLEKLVKAIPEKAKVASQPKAEVVSTGQTTTVQNTATTTQTVTVNVDNLPGTITLSDKNIYFLAETKDMFGLAMKLDGGYDKVGVTHGSTQEYFLKSYKKGADTANYNIGEKIKNVAKGVNNYTIKLYKNDKAEKTFKLTIHYIDKPTQQVAVTPAANSGTDLSGQNQQSPVVANTGTVATGENTDELNQPQVNDNKIKVVYFTEESNRFIAMKLNQIIEKRNIKDKFEFIEFSSPEQFEKNILSGEYDIVIGGIDIGYKKDISDLFVVDSSLVNPSNYKSNDLSSLINQYFLSSGSVKQKIKKEINDIYSKSLPYLILGKPVSHINLRSDLNFSFPFKLYGYGLRKDFLGGIKLINKPNLDTKQLLNLGNFIKFIKDGIK